MQGAWVQSPGWGTNAPQAEEHEEQQQQQNQISSFKKSNLEKSFVNGINLTVSMISSEDEKKKENIKGGRRPRYFRSKQVTKELIK